MNMNKEDSKLAVFEEANVAFDPTTQHLDLTKNEKRRTTALMMAIQAYRELIIKDADYLREASNIARNNNGPALKPATIDAMVDAAIKFDIFIASGARDGDAVKGGSMTEIEDEAAT